MHAGASRICRFSGDLCVPSCEKLHILCTHTRVATHVAVYMHASPGVMRFR